VEGVPTSGDLSQIQEVQEFLDRDTGVSAADTPGQ
jgi:hypothetical protein